MQHIGDEPAAEDRHAQLLAAAAVRELAGALVERITDADTLAAVTDAAQQLTARVRRGEARDFRAAMRDSIVTRGAGASAVVERAVGGPANPTAVPLWMQNSADSVSAEFVIDPVFAGWPGWAHGGTVAGLIDDVLGQMASILGGYTATARLEIDFRLPTPVGRLLRIESRPSTVEGGRIAVEGAIFDGAEKLVTARGVFAVVGAEVLQ